MPRTALAQGLRCIPNSMLFCHFGLDPLHERQRGNLEPKGAAH
ncbi:hypothetical protein HMPREF9404_5678 [Eggerthella sp. HGA1]|nr:hypothetical protein HMPREF9404_5678 [Eggerthella sp. HGA1]